MLIYFIFRWRPPSGYVFIALGVLGIPFSGYLYGVSPIADVQYIRQEKETGISSLVSSMYLPRRAVRIPMWGSSMSLTREADRISTWGSSMSLTRGVDRIPTWGSSCNRLEGQQRFLSEDLKYVAALGATRIPTKGSNMQLPWGAAKIPMWGSNI